MKSPNVFASRLRRTSSGLAASLLLGAAALPSRADVVDAEFDYQTPGLYSYAISYMPDFDQRRAGLASNGSMHCVPTSMMNMFGYAAHFGFPDLLPGPGDWTHLEISIHVLNLGLEMGTSGVTGTTGSGLLDGVEAWLAQSDLESMPFVSFVKGGGYWPTIDDGAMMATQGGLVSFCFGRYETAPGGPNGIPWLTDRASGHCVTLQRTVAENGAVLGPRALQYRDPGSINDNNLGLNSPFSSVDAATAANIEIARDLDGDGEFNIYPVTSLNNPPPDDGRYRVIDGFYTLYPPGGMTFTEVEVAAQFANGNLGFVQDQIPVPFSMPAGARILSVIPHPELHSALALLEQRGGHKLLARLPHAAASSKPKEIVVVGSVPRDSAALVLGYGHSVFVVGQREILHLETPGQSAHIAARAPLPRQVAGHRIDAATYNHDTHEILLISSTPRRLFALDPATLALRGAYNLIAPFPVPGIRSLTAWGAPRGRALAALANGQLMQIDYQPQTARGDGDSDARDFLIWQRALGSSLSLPGVKDALSADLDSAGRLYVSDRRTGLNEFTMNHQHGAWQRAARPLYAKFNLAGRKFAPFKSRANHRPELHDTPEWNNIPADELIPLGPDLPDATPQR